MKEYEFFTRNTAYGAKTAEAIADVLKLKLRLPMTTCTDTGTGKMLHSMWQAHAWMVLYKHVLDMKIRITKTRINALCLPCPNEKIVVRMVK